MAKIVLCDLKGKPYPDTEPIPISDKNHKYLMSLDNPNEVLNIILERAMTEEIVPKTNDEHIKKLEKLIELLEREKKLMK